MNILGIKLKLVQDWKESYKWLSVHLFTLLAAASGAWYAIPGEWKAAIPPEYLGIAAGAMGALGVVARLTDQTFVSTTAPQVQAEAEQVPDHNR